MRIFAILALLTTLLFSAVDINNASAEELASLKGIGMKKAAKIIKYREEHCFKELKELKKVKGIKKKHYKKIMKKNKGNIALGACKTSAESTEDEE